METTQNQTPEVKKTSKNNYETMDESIVKMKEAFSNASLPEIFAVMVTVGYTAEKIAELNAKTLALETLCQVQTKEYADQYAGQEKFKEKHAEINAVFNQHRSLLRVFFKSNIQAWVALKLDIPNPKAYSTWLELLTSFYAQIVSDPNLLAQVQTVSISMEAITEQTQALAELQTIKGSLRHETSEAQEATETRDRAFDELYPLYSEYIRYAKILLPNDQKLEAIGVRVK